MRIYVLLDSEGRVIGTAPFGAQNIGGEQGAEDSSITLEARPIALEGQAVQEIVVPTELEELSPLHLHRAMEGYEIRVGQENPIERRS
jgi:hypothetical protein